MTAIRERLTGLLAAVALMSLGCQPHVSASPAAPARPARGVSPGSPATGQSPAPLPAANRTADASRASLAVADGGATVAAAAPAGSLRDVTCGVGPSRRLGVSSAQVHGLGLSSSSSGYLAAWPSSEREASVQTIDASGVERGEPFTLSLPSANYVQGVHALGWRYLLLTHALCPDGKRMEKCLQLSAVDKATRAQGPVLEDRTVEWIQVVDQSVRADEFLMLRAYHYRAPELVRYRIDTTLAVNRDVPLDLSEVKVEDAELWTGSTHAERAWALVRSAGVALYLEGSRKVQVAGLVPEARVVDTFSAAEGPQLLLLDGSAVSRAALGWSGTLRERPSKLAKLPPVFAGRFRGQVANDKRRLLFTRHDAAQRALGKPLELDTKPAAYATLACDETATRCGVLWARSGKPAEIMVAGVECR